MASRNRRSGRQRGASRGQQGSTAWLWLLAGILIGLGLAYYLFVKGIIPQPRAQQPVAEQTLGSKEPPIAEKPAAREPEKPEYDFFTVLPEMEVVVPEQELTARRDEADSSAEEVVGGGSDSYLIQVGSFQGASDAEQMKAQLALLGITARVQSVRVNDSTWHRVRVGPVNGARAADDLRRQLAQNGIDSLVMKNP